MGVVTASAIAQQGLTAHKENKTDETGREVEVAGVEGEEEKEDEGNKDENGDLYRHMNSYVDINSYEGNMEENGDLYGHMNSYVDMNSYEGNMEENRDLYGHMNSYLDMNLYEEKRDEGGGGAAVSTEKAGWDGMVIHGPSTPETSAEDAPPDEGGEVGAGELFRVREQRMTASKPDMSAEVDLTERDIVWRSGWRSRPPIEWVGITNSSEETRWEAETGQLTTNDSTTIGPLEPVHDSITPSLSERDDPTILSLSEPVHEPINQSPSERELFAKLKQENDLAKAVKSDDAEVPVDLLDQAVCRAPPSEEVEKKALRMRKGTVGTSTTNRWSAVIMGCAEHTLSIFNVKIVGWLTSKDASPLKDWMTRISF